LTFIKSKWCENQLAKCFQKIARMHVQRAIGPARMINV
jgi:hypothetical protein